MCTGNDGEVYIDEIISTEEEQGNQGGNQGGDQVTAGSLTDRSLRDQMRALRSQLQGIKTQIAEIDNRLVTNALATTRQLQTLNANMKQVGLSPARPIRSTTSRHVSVVLSPHPRTLYEVWVEYNNGIGGRKPARKFSSQERGKVKYKYYRRKNYGILS